MAYTPRKTPQWLGVQQVGDLFTFWIVTRNGAGTPTIPDACPTYHILTAGGTEVVAASKMAIRDRYGLDSSGANNCVFEATQQINSSFSAGSHYVIFQWRISSALYKEVDVFQVDATVTDPAGQILALDWLPKAEADLTLHTLADGDLENGRNPF